ncbi:hypothetical protein [Streptomyces sp. NPDC005784]|uniref:hypothetical protein n=1 Tax=Streptomyces sp. NPDC005784 TaxID=3364731 RepID=UPI00368F1286
MNAEGMLDEVVETLEPHAMYYNHGRDDNARHFPDAQVLHYLSLVLTSVILPILANVISDEIKEKLKKKRDASDINEAVRQASAGSAPSREAVEAATEAAAQVLHRYGWPSAPADSDAESVVTRVTDSIFRATRMEWSDLRHLQDASILEGANVYVGASEIWGRPLNGEAALGRTRAALMDLVREFPHRRPSDGSLTVVNHPSLTIESGSGYRIVRGSVDVSTYWNNWETCCDAWFFTPNKPDESHASASAIFRAINEESDLSFLERRDLVQRLWSDRWIFEADDAALIMRLFEQMAKIPQDADRLEGLVEEVTSRLAVLKNNCRSLDEWFEGLRELVPLIMRGYVMAMRLRDNTTHRLFDEMQADLRVVLGLPFDMYASRSNFFERQIGIMSRDRTERKRELRFKLNARIFFPRFWYDSALAYLEAGEVDVPTELTQFDIPTAVACWMTADLGFAMDRIKGMDVVPPDRPLTAEVLPFPPF